MTHSFHNHIIAQTANLRMLRDKKLLAKNIQTELGLREKRIYSSMNRSTTFYFYQYSNKPIKLSFT